MTIAEKLAWKRFLLTLLYTVLSTAWPVIEETLKDGNKLAELGIPSLVAALLLSGVAALIKYYKEKDRGL